jgi:hypothetical protein
MFYPTCYVYKIGINDESATTNESNSTSKTIYINKKIKICFLTTKKKTTVSTTISRPIDDTIKIESSLIKKFANNLLISAQRNNCIDLEKK